MGGLAGESGARRGRSGLGEGEQMCLFRWLQDIEAVLRPLLMELIAARSQAGLALEEALPVFVATDTYHKHYRKYTELMREMAALLRRQPFGETPRGPASGVGVLPHHPSDALTTIAGEPFHDVINARKYVSAQANDAVDFIFDHTDLMCRLSAPPRPASVGATAPQLSLSGQGLLKAGIELSAEDFKHRLQSDSGHAAELRAFLASPGVRKAKAIWAAAAGAQPPRPVIARLARRAGAQVDSACGWFNYKDAKDFKSEVRRMRRWYKMPRRLSRRCLGMLRVRADTGGRGRARVWSPKLAAHYVRLTKQLRLQGLMHWRKCVLALHMAGVPVHSGTLPVERHWAQYASYWPPANKAIDEESFTLLSNIAFLRVAWCHFHKPWLPGWARGDVLLQQRVSEMHALMLTAEAGETPLVEKELVASFQRAFGLPGGCSGDAHSHSPRRVSTEACSVPPVPFADQQATLSVGVLLRGMLK